MPKIMVSLAPRGALSFIINMIVRPSRSTQRLSTGGSRRVEFINFRHFWHYSTFGTFFSVFEDELLISG